MKMNSSNIDPRLLRLSSQDNVLILSATVDAGETVVIDSMPVVVPSRLALGHKLAARDIAAGEKIIKYGVSIGSAKQNIPRGEHVHTHNIQSDYFPTYTLDGQNTFIAH